jgi:hypothetical protein
MEGGLLANLESSNETVRAFDPGASAGLFVGVSSFEDERIASVPFAVDDAVDLAYLFAEELGLILPERAVLLLAGEPRKLESIERLAQLRQHGARRLIARTTDVYRFVGTLARGTEKNGIFIFTMATHGVSDQGGDFLVATDSLRERTLRTGVAVAEAFDEIAHSGAERRLVLLDACRERLSAGTRGEGNSAMKPSFAEAIAQAKGSVILSAATLGGFAYDDSLRQNGVFTAAVLDGLHGEAPAGQDGWITVRTLADFVQQRVSTWILRNRPEDAVKSLGIARHIESTAESVPLALHPKFRHELPERPVLVAAQVEDSPTEDWRILAINIINKGQETFPVSNRAKADLAFLRQRISDADLSLSEVARNLEDIFSQDIQATKERIAPLAKTVNRQATIDRLEYRLETQLLNLCWPECVPINLAIIDFYTDAAVRSERWANEFFDHHISSFGVRRWEVRKTAPYGVIHRLANFVSSKMFILVGDWKAETLRPLLKNVAPKLEPHVSSAAASFHEAVRSEIEEADMPVLSPRNPVLFSSWAVAGWMESRVTIPWLNLFTVPYLKGAQLAFIHAKGTPRDRLRATLVKEILSNGERQDSSLYKDLSRYLQTFIATPVRNYTRDALEGQEEKLARENKVLRELERAKTEAADLLNQS